MDVGFHTVKNDTKKKIEEKIKMKLKSSAHNYNVITAIFHNVKMKKKHRKSIIFVTSFLVK